MDKIKNEEYKTFEDIKHINENGVEYWEARELQVVLEYSQWRRFEGVINKAIIACKNSNYEPSDHFATVGKIVKAGATTKKVDDFLLTRYACYLIVQNADPRKKVIAQGQTYFAIQTRKQEITEAEYLLLSEDEKRIYKRKQTKKKNLNLYQAAKNAGVKNYDKFTNFGYKGLYNGETADDIFKRKKLRYREDILDNMGSVELSANEFRISQTEDKLKRDNVKTEREANKTHFAVGKAVREAIEKIGGTMPEDLPTPKKSISELEKENKRKLANSNKKLNLDKYDGKEKIERMIENERK